VIKFLKWYFRVSLVLRILVCLAAGAVIGISLWLTSEHTTLINLPAIIKIVAPFGNVFVYMLKMIVVPVIFFSLVLGAGSLPLKKFGAVGAKTIGWYFLTSVFAAVIGTFLALLLNPGSGSGLADWNQMASQLSAQAHEISTAAQDDGTFTSLLYGMFQNPFRSLAEGNFLPIIVFAILFGLAVRVCMEATEDKQSVGRLHQLMDIMEACRDAMFKIVDWVLEYSPVGVLALTIVNFALYGPKIVGPYVSITLGVIGGIFVMVLIVYPVLMWIVTRHNPFVVLKKVQEAMIMAFMTRSSAATLPVSMKVAGDELKIHDELSSFSLPLGATINMDGVCVHLPMFAVLASNMFGLELTAYSLFVLVMTTVLASIGAGGVPGGSLMLLFIILRTLGLDADQVSIIVALALGINPVLDMFETMNNVTGDLVCTYTVARREKLINE
jgi:proton glutamate symport protein